VSSYIAPEFMCNRYSFAAGSYGQDNGILPTSGSGACDGKPNTAATTLAGDVLEPAAVGRASELAGRIRTSDNHREPLVEQVLLVGELG